MDSLHVRLQRADIEQLKTADLLGAYSIREPVETQVQLALTWTTPTGIRLAQKQSAGANGSQLTHGS